MSTKTVTTPRKIEQAFCIMDFIKSSTKKFPDKECFNYRRGKEYFSVSYREFHALVDTLSAGLLKLGLKDEHIALIGEKCVEWVATYFAVINIGAVIVPLDKDLETNQIPGFIDFADCSAVIYTENFHDLFLENVDTLPNIKNFIEINREIPANKIVENSNFKSEHFMNFEQAVLSDPDLAIIESEPDVEKMSAIIFTSGTTGTAKGVMLSQKNLVFCVNQAMKFVDITNGDVVLSILPFHHTYEMSAGILSALMSGSTICLNNRITSLLQDLKYYRPTILALVPLIVSTMYKRIIETAKKQNKLKKIESGKRISRNLLRIGLDIRDKIFFPVLQAFGGRLTKIVCGGAAISAELVKNFREFGVTIQQGYGITECSPVIAIVPCDKFNPSACGIPLPGVQVLIDKENTDEPCGEICVKGDNVMIGYYKNQDATAEAISNHGWFATGDLGYMDKSGYLYITGRKKNTIVLDNGKNVAPEELEEYLEKIPLIADCMVTLRQVDNTSKITAIIYPDYEKSAEEGLTDRDALKNYFIENITAINKSISSYKQIRNVEIRKAPFPKTSTQKIQRHKVTKEED